jgi:alginate O-acetyltransferase complex protein AlgI
VDYLAAMIRFDRMATPPVETRLLLDGQALAAIAAGIVFAFPALPWALDRLRATRLSPALYLEPQLDTQAVHVLPTPLLLGALVVSVAILAGTTLNPFLYFRF